MKIRKAFLPANSILVNVCSYPSAGSGGNNNPFDCILSPGGGLLVIKKVANAYTTSTTSFNFLVNPVPSGELSNYPVTGSGQTLPIGLAIGNSCETVTETVSQNWTLTGAVCTLEGGAVTGSFDNANHRVTSITIESGKTTTCTFTNNEQFSSLTLAKSANPASYNTVGQVITYTYTISNSGNTTLAGPFSVSDDKQGTINSCGTGPLAVSGSTSCTSTRTITQADIDAGSITNIATASGNGVTSNQASATVTATPVPALTLVKSADPTSYNAVGQVITYTYIITNSGNTTLAGPFTVTDNLQGTISCGTGPLAPSASISCTSTHTITQADIDAGSITNTATASSGGITSNIASITVMANRTISIDLLTTATPNLSSPPVAGDTINYNYKITNTGNVTLSGVVLTDVDLAAYATGGICGGVTTLNPGASVTCSGTYSVKPQDISGGHLSVTNVAQACGNPPSGAPVCDSLNIVVEQ